MKEKIIIKADLEAAIAQYIVAADEYEAFLATKKEVTSKRPPVAKLYDNVEDYNLYVHACECYDTEVDEWNIKQSALSHQLTETEKMLLALIPRNVWIGTIYNNKPVWVGANTSNWGGGTITVNITSTKPANSLRHTDYD